jgi:pimeloyl-ACP methyl ester carboxylesterase
VERANRVCSYDRAGSGWSDPSTETTRASTSQDLHKLLEVAGERGPFVLVGASRGGLLVRAYLAEYPAEVAGLVLIDPSSEDRLFTMLNGEGVLIASLTADQLRTTFPTGPVPIPRRNPQTGAPFDKLPAELYQTRIKLDQKLIDETPAEVPASAVTSSQEGERAFLAKLLATRSGGEHPLGDLPMVVLSRGVDSDPEPRATHAHLAALSTNSRHTVVQGAGHEIHLFEPSAVVVAIGDVVEAVRSHGRVKERP